jgi:hypothetical protein
MGPIVGETLSEALEKIAAGERGTAQEGGSYETFFTADDVWLDRTRTARELHRLAWAWRYTPPIGLDRAGLLVDVEGETVRVLRSSLEELAGAVRIDCADGPLWVITEPVDPPSG